MVAGLSSNRANESSPLLPKTVQDMAAPDTNGTPTAISDEPASPSTVTQRPDLCGESGSAHTHYLRPVLGGPLSGAAPRSGVVNEINEINEVDEPDEETALLSFPDPSFEAENAEENHNVWDVLCHSIESLTAAGTVGTVGAVIVLVFLISTFTQLVPLIMGPGSDKKFGHGDNNQTVDIGLGGTGFFENIGDSLLAAFRQAAVANLTAVDFNGIKDGNIQLRVTAQLAMNYTQIENRRLAWFIQTLALPVYSIGIKNMTAILFIKGKEPAQRWDQSFESVWGSGDFSTANSDFFKHALTISIPSVDEIKVRHNDPTFIDIVANVSSFENPSLLSDTIRRLLVGDVVTARVLTEVEPHKGFVSFGRFPIFVETTINPNSHKGVPLDDLFSKQLKLSALEMTPDVPADPTQGKYGAIDVAATIVLKDALEMVFAAFNLSSAVLDKLPISRNLSFPSLFWEVAIPGCHYDENGSDVLRVSGMKTLPFGLLQDSAVPEGAGSIRVSAEASVPKLSEGLAVPCLDSNHSALDAFLQQYLSGQKTHIIVKGASAVQNSGLPEWAARMLAKVQVSVPVLGRGGPAQADDEKLVKEVSLSQLKISLPPPKSPFERPGAPDVPPRISAHVEMTLHPPSVLNITQDLGVAVGRVRGPVDLVDAGTGVLFAKFNVSTWVDCITTTRPETEGFARESGEARRPPLLDYVVSFDIEQLPMTVVDQKQLTAVATQLVLKGQVPVKFGAVVDLQMNTTVGDFVLNKIPVEGTTVMRQ